jgi:hypothetical protein
MLPNTTTDKNNLRDPPPHPPFPFIFSQPFATSAVNPCYVRVAIVTYFKEVCVFFTKAWRGAVAHLWPRVDPNPAYVVVETDVCLQDELVAPEDVSWGGIPHIKHLAIGEERELCESRIKQHSKTTNTAFLSSM